MRDRGILDHTMLRVEDLDASLDWYTEHCGYEEIGRWTPKRSRTSTWSRPTPARRRRTWN